MKGGFLSGGARRSGTNVVVTGIWVRAGNPGGTTVEVLAEVGGMWKLIATEKCDGPFSHIVEPAGIANAPRDSRTQDFGQQLAERD